MDTYQLPSNLTVGGPALSGRRVRERRQHHPGARLQPDRRAGRVPIQQHLGLRLNVYNLTDREYIRSINNNGNRYNPGTPFSMLLPRRRGSDDDLPPAGARAARGGDRPGTTPERERPRGPPSKEHGRPSARRQTQCRKAAGCAPPAARGHSLRRGSAGRTISTRLVRNTANPVRTAERLSPSAHATPLAGAIQAANCGDRSADVKSSALMPPAHPAPRWPVRAPRQIIHMHGTAPSTKNRTGDRPARRANPPGACLDPH